MLKDTGCTKTVPDLPQGRMANHERKKEKNNERERKKDLEN